MADAVGDTTSNNNNNNNDDTDVIEEEEETTTTTTTSKKTSQWRKTRSTKVRLGRGQFVKLQQGKSKQKKKNRLISRTGQGLWQSAITCCILWHSQIDRLCVSVCVCTERWSHDRVRVRVRPRPRPLYWEHFEADKCDRLKVAKMDNRIDEDEADRRIGGQRQRGREGRSCWRATCIRNAFWRSNKQRIFGEFQTATKYKIRK